VKEFHNNRLAQNRDAAGRTKLLVGVAFCSKEPFCEQMRRVEALLAEEVERTQADKTAAMGLKAALQMPQPALCRGINAELVDALEHAREVITAINAGDAEAAARAAISFATSLDRYGHPMAFHDERVGRKCREAAPTGGRIRKAESSRTSTRNARWRADAEQMRERKPHLTVSAVAKLIAAKEGVNSRTVASVLFGERG
jgi:hypothetical protein